MLTEHTLPADIERESMRIIKRELDSRNMYLEEENEAVIKRVIHTTADFDYAVNLKFTEKAVQNGVNALRLGNVIVTDTNMARAGVSKPSLSKTGGNVYCFMAEEKIAQKAKKDKTTRAAASMRYAAEKYPNAIFVVGNAPTALMELSSLIKDGLRPSMVIAVPVGFVNVEQSKREIFDICTKENIPAIAAMGRKGGSNVAAAICNALLYTAVHTLDPSARGWQG